MTRLTLLCYKSLTLYYDNNYLNICLIAFNMYTTIMCLFLQNTSIDVYSTVL